MTTITQIDTSALSNQSLATALLVHTFTNTTRVRKVFVQVDLDQIAGNGNYTVYATIQRAGAGSAFRVIPITTAAVASGITSAAFQTAGFPLNATDVLKVYVLGLAGDTTTPDIVTRVWEELPFSAAEYTAPPTAAQNADAVWDEARSEHATAGTFGEKVNAELDSASVSAVQSGLATSAQVTALSASTVQVASPNVSGNLVLTQGDDYDGTANPKASWTVTTDYTSGWTVALTIRDADDAVVYTTAGTVVSSTVVAVTIAAPTGLTMTGCPGQWQGKFDVQLTHTATGKKKTIALGVCYINEDQTR